jgi:hypothetical protein
MGIAKGLGLKIGAPAVESEVDSLIIITIAMFLVTMAAGVAEMFSQSFFAIILNFLIPIGLFVCAYRGSKKGNGSMLGCYCFWSGCSFAFACIYFSIYVTTYLEWGKHAHEISVNKGNPNFVCLPGDVKPDITYNEKHLESVCFCYDKAECPHVGINNYTHCPTQFTVSRQMRGFAESVIDCPSYPAKILYYTELFKITAYLQLAAGLIFCCGCLKSSRLKGHPYFTQAMYRSDGMSSIQEMHYDLVEPQNQGDFKLMVNDAENPKSY